MRAFRCHHISEDISTISLDEVTLAPPGPGEVRLRLKACAVNFPDILMIQGKYQFKPELPFAPGMEGAGLIEAVGAGVKGFKEGDAVVASFRCGGFADGVNAAADKLAPLPARLDFVHGAAYRAAYNTAYVALFRRAQLQPGEVLLVHGAAGGVGLAAVEVGKILGATVIATSSSDEKLAKIKPHGADHLINVSRGFREKVKQLTGEKGADVIYDPVGGDIFDESVRCIAWGGRLLVIGFAGGRIPSIGANMPLIKGFSVVGVRAGEYGRRDPVKGAENLARIDGWAADGTIRPHVCITFPLERSVDALRMLAERRAVGKVVIAMSADAGHADDGNG
jgi:NADPH2:quinone reductase